MKIFDAHADIITDISVHRKKGEENIVKNYHLERFKKGEIMGAIFSAWLDNSYPDETTEKEFIYMLNSASHEINSNPDIFNVIKNKGDFEKGLTNGKFNVLMGVEGLRAIGNNLDWIDSLYLLGYRHATLTWNEKNSLAAGAKAEIDTGLSELGKEAVKKMNKLGMIVDVSHASEKTFWGIYETSTKPIIASHSNAKALCNVPRNLTDEQIKAIAKSGGVIGINAYAGFIKECAYSNPVPSAYVDNSQNPTISDLVDHIDYIVKLTDINHVGFGFDFCEYLSEELRMSIPKDFENCSKAQNIILELRKRGYSEENIEKIAYKNFMRVIDEVLL